MNKCCFESNNLLKFIIIVIIKTFKSSLYVNDLYDMCLKEFKFSLLLNYGLHVLMIYHYLKLI